MAVKAQKNRIQYTCQSCGHVSPRWMGHCSECNEWNTFVEEVVPKKLAKTARQQTERPSVAINLSDIDYKHQERISARSTEFNRVLGGGVVPGSVVLLGGDPGIGKSTLMLQEGVGLANEHFPVLFVSGEESIRQTKLRADRLGIDSGHLYVLAETNMSEILSRIEQLNPKLVVVDSIQTVYRPEFESSPGSINQVRNCAYEFIQCAKKQNVPIFLVGHVTKEGYIAGPKVLEHMVDVLLQFEGDRDHFYRILRSIKNRFGSTREIGVFEMTQKGLEEVPNPSSLFLEQRKENVTGSCVVCTMEGTRPFLVEIQALVSSANFGLPQRTATGIDNKRLSLLLAVLEKRVGLRISGQDVFVNAAGGVRIDEPAADLGILVSMASSFKEQVVDPHAVIIGEVGLGGEIRTIPQIDKRIDEAAKLGFKRAVIPKLSQKGIKSTGSLKVSFVDKVEEALEEVLN